jgi:hypothetical protein
MITIRRAEGRDAAGISHVPVQSWRTTYEGMAPTELIASLNEEERIPRWQVHRRFATAQIHSRLYARSS